MAVGGRDPDRGRLAVRPEADGVDVDLGVVEAGAPAQEHLLERVDRRRRRSRTWSAIGARLGASETIRPTFRSWFGQPSSRLPIPGANESSTVEWQRAQVMPIELSEPPLSKNALDADDRVQLQERERGRRIVEIDLALLELRLEVPREGIDVDLQAGDGEGRLRADTRADASEGGALDRLVQLEHRPSSPRRRRCRSGRSPCPAGAGRRRPDRRRRRRRRPFR